MAKSPTQSLRLKPSSTQCTSEIDALKKQSADTNAAEVKFDVVASIDKLAIENEILHKKIDELLTELETAKQGSM